MMHCGATNIITTCKPRFKSRILYPNPLASFSPLKLCVHVHIRVCMDLSGFVPFRHASAEAHMEGPRNACVSREVSQGRGEPAGPGGTGGPAPGDGGRGGICVGGGSADARVSRGLLRRAFVASQVGSRRHVPRLGTPFIRYPAPPPRLEGPPYFTALAVLELSKTHCGK